MKPCYHFFDLLYLKKNANELPKVVQVVKIAQSGPGVNLVKLFCKWFNYARPIHVNKSFPNALILSSLLKRVSFKLNKYFNRCIKLYYLCYMPVAYSKHHCCYHCMQHTALVACIIFKCLHASDQQLASCPQCRREVKSITYASSGLYYKKIMTIISEDHK